MKRLPVIVAAAFALTPLPAVAASDCEAQWKWALETADIAAESTFRPSSVATGGCLIRDVTLTEVGGGQAELRIGSLYWAADGLARTVEDGTPPHALSLNAEGVRYVPRINDPVMDYLFSAQSVGQGTDIQLDAEWMADARRLVLERLVLDFPGDDHVALSGSVDRVNLNSLSAAQLSVGTMGLTEAKLDITTKGLFEKYLLFALGAAVLDGTDDPDRRVAQLKDEARAAIDTMPGDLLDASSRTAALQLLDDLPNPYGRISFTVDAPAGIGLTRFIPLAMHDGPKAPEDIWPLFGGVALGLAYTPADRN